MKIIVDSSSLMILDNLPEDIFKGLWDYVRVNFDTGEWFSVREVWKELKDSQQYWEDYEHCFRELDDKESEYMGYVVSSEKFTVFQDNGMKSNDEPWADPHLIACAMNSDEAIIITEENLNSQPLRKIPYVCQELNKECFNITCISFYDFLRQNNIKF